MLGYRILALVLALLGAGVAVLAPWRHIRNDGLCIFEPCDPPQLVVVRGALAPGGVAAALCLVAVLALVALPRREAGRAIAGVLLGLAIAWCGVSAATGAFVIFGEDLGPGWAPFATAACALAALAVLFWRPIPDADAGADPAQE